jgi:AmiR/NasT family two-component response regulator
MMVWVAVGMLMERTRLSNRDALDVLRGYAFSHQMTLDAVAAKLSSQDLTTEEVVI